MIRVGEFTDEQLSKELAYLYTKQDELRSFFDGGYLKTFRKWMTERTDELETEMRKRNKPMKPTTTKPPDAEISASLTLPTADFLLNITRYHSRVARSIDGFNVGTDDAAAEQLFKSVGRDMRNGMFEAIAGIKACRARLDAAKDAKRRYKAPTEATEGGMGALVHELVVPEDVWWKSKGRFEEFAAQALVIVTNAAMGPKFYAKGSGTGKTCSGPLLTTTGEMIRQIAKLASRSGYLARKPTSKEMASGKVGPKTARAFAKTVVDVIGAKPTRLGIQGDDNLSYLLLDLSIAVGLEPETARL